jgi:hypothetical protein
VNFGFDGTSYQRDWPDGNTVLHPTPVLISSPLTGPTFKINYSHVAFEADTPVIEQATCNRDTGASCALPPTTDDGVSAAFYPFFSATRATRTRACLARAG